MAGRDLWVITGLSGAGRTTALRALEDLGYFCVDNLPASLIGNLLELLDTEERHDPVAVGVDIRRGKELTHAPEALDQLEKSGVTLRVLFLDCASDVLLRRFSETRRPHHLAADANVAKAIEEERQVISGLRARAERIIDTSNLSVHELKRAVYSYVSRYDAKDDTPKLKHGLQVRVVSFGFKYGMPAHADLVFDVRYLPNPYFIPELKHKTGLDKEVFDYVLEQPDAQTFLQGHLLPMLENLLPRYREEGRAYLTVAIGCTGGKHRSVTLSIALFEAIEKLGYEVSCAHRDVERH